MRKNVFILILLLFVCYSCSGDIDSIDSPSNDTTEPYISPKLQSIINMTDTCKSSIPLDALLPNLNNLISNNTVSKKISSRASGDVVSYKGYSTYKVLKLKSSVTITDQQSFNLGMTNKLTNPKGGKYFVDVYVITLNVINPGGSIIENINTDDIIGIKPDNEEEKGFKIEEISPNKYYRLTTYLWALRETDNQSQPIDIIDQVIPLGMLLRDSPYYNNPVYIIKNLLTWNYYIL